MVGFAKSSSLAFVYIREEKKLYRPPFAKRKFIIHANGT